MGLKGEAPVVKKKSKKAKEAYVYHIWCQGEALTQAGFFFFFREEQPEKITLPEPDLQVEIIITEPLLPFPKTSMSF